MTHGLNGYYAIGGLGKLIKVGDRYILARQQSFAPCPPNSLARRSDDCFVQQPGESIEAFVNRCCVSTAELPYGAIPNLMPVRPIAAPVAPISAPKQKGFFIRLWEKLFGR